MIKAKTKKSALKRLKVTKHKIARRSTSLGHCRANKRTTQMKRRKRYRTLDMPQKVINKYI